MYFPFIINVSHCWKYLEYLLDTLSVWLIFVYIADTQVFAIIVNITFPFLYSFSTMLLIPHLFKWHGQNLKYFTRNSYIKKSISDFERAFQYCCWTSVGKSQYLISYANVRENYCNAYYVSNWNWMTVWASYLSQFTPGNYDACCH